MEETQISNIPQIESPKFNFLNFIKNQSLIAKIIGIIVILAVVGVGTALATRIWDPLWNPFRPSPEKVTSKVLEKMGDIKSLHTGIKIDIENIDGDGNRMNHLFIEFNDESDISNLDNIKSKGGFDSEFELGGMGIFLVGNYVKKDGEWFLKLSKVPDLSFLLGLDFSSLANQWIKGGKKESSTELFINRRIINILKNKTIFSVKDELPDEKIDNKKVYHFAVILNREVIKELTRGFSGDVAGQASFSVDTVEQQSGEFLGKLDNLEVEAWIGKKDNLLYRIRIYGEDIKDSKQKDIVNIEFNFSNFNEPIEVEIPKDYKNFEEISGDFMGLGMQMFISGNIPLANGDQDFGEYNMTIDDEASFALMGLANKFKESYGLKNSYKGFSCSLSTGTIELCSEIKSLKGSNPKIHTSEDGFCMYIKLDTGDYFCVDKEMSVNLTTELDCSVDYLYCSRFFIENF